MGLLWAGGFSLVYLSLLVFSFLSLSEGSKLVKWLSVSLLLVAISFFITKSLLIFFLTFELASLPVVFLTLIKGSQIEKVSAFYYLLIYSFLFGYMLLFSILLSGGLGSFHSVISVSDFLISSWVGLLYSLAFLMKFPIWFLHYWLPKMHVEASTSASMLLASLLLKLGTYGFLLLNLKFFLFSEMALLANLGLILGSFVCLSQSDTKALIAYSSVVHMGLVYLFLMSGGEVSGTASLWMMISHGYISLLLFFLVGELSHLFSTRLLYYNLGLFLKCFFLALSLSGVLLLNSSIPPSLGFLSELKGLESYFFMSQFAYISVGFYFFFSFYYSLYLLMGALMGKLVSGFFCSILSLGGLILMISLNLVTWMAVGLLGL